MGIIFGVIAAIFWGLGDFLISLLTRHIGTLRALIGVQVLSLLSWLVILSLTPSITISGPTLWLLILGTAVCHVLGLIFVYRAFEIGTLSIVSPISAGFAVVTAILALASGERPPAVALAGAALLIGGTIFATRSSAGPRERGAVWRGVPEAIISAFAFGTMFWLFCFFVQPKLGYSFPLVVLKTMAVISSVVLYFLRPRRDAMPVARFGSRMILLAIGATCADTFAWLAYIRGAHTTYATLVTALASLFSVVTVILAWRFLRERLSAPQWVGVAAILFGILVVSF